MSRLSKFRVGQHVVIGTHTPHYDAFFLARARGTPILGIPVWIRGITIYIGECGERVIDYTVQAGPVTGDPEVAGTVQVLREEDLTADLRSKFQPGQRVRVVAKVPSHGAWSHYIAHGAEGVVRSRPSARPQSREYPSGFVVTVRLDGTSYDQNVNPEDLEPLEN